MQGDTGRCREMQGDCLTRIVQWGEAQKLLNHEPRPRSHTCSKGREGLPYMGGEALLPVAKGGRGCLVWEGRLFYL